MFVLCPHCQFLVALDPVSGIPPQRCPRCEVALQPTAAPAATNASTTLAQEPFAPTPGDTTAAPPTRTGPAPATASKPASAPESEEALESAAASDPGAKPAAAPEPATAPAAAPVAEPA